MGAGFQITLPVVGQQHNATFAGDMLVEVNNNDTAVNKAFVAGIEEDMNATVPSSTTALSDPSPNGTGVFFSGNVPCMNVAGLPTTPPAAVNRLVMVAVNFNGTFGPFDKHPIKAFRPGSFEGTILASLQTLKRPDDVSTPLPSTVKINTLLSPKSRGRKAPASSGQAVIQPLLAPEAPPEPAPLPTPTRRAAPERKQPASTPKRAAKPNRKAIPKPAKKSAVPAKRGGKTAKPAAPKRGKKAETAPPPAERTKKAKAKPAPSPKKAKDAKPAKPKKPKAVLRYCSLDHYADCWISPPTDAHGPDSTPSYWILRRMDPATWELELRRGEKRVVQYLARNDATPGLTLPNLFRLASSEDNSWPQSIHLTPAL